MNRQYPPPIDRLLEDLGLLATQITWCGVCGYPMFLHDDGVCPPAPPATAQEGEG